MIGSLPPIDDLPTHPHMVAEEIWKDIPGFPDYQASDLGSRGANHRHAYRTGLREPVGKKLTNDQVRQIAALAGTAPQKEIARQFGVSRTTVNLIHSRKRHSFLLT